MEFNASRLQRDWRNERLIMALRGAGWGHRHRLIIANQIHLLVFSFFFAKINSKRIIYIFTIILMI